MAVYTDVTDEQLAAFLGEYDLGSLVAFRGIAEGVENSNFSLRTTAGDYILTLYERRVDPEELPWFLGLMRHLAGRGINCPLPVAGSDGQALRRLAGRHAAITTFLEGVWPRRVRPEHCRALGAALAGLHDAGRSYAPRRRNTLGPEAWGGLLEQSRPRADEVQAGLGDELARQLDSILKSWPSDLPTGHIHADLFPDNVFFLHGALTGLIDFYFACTDALAYDLAVCLNAWCFEPDRQFNVTKARALLLSYGQTRALEPEELQALPTLARGAALRFLATRLYDWLHTPAGATVVRKDPLEYLHKLRFHAECAGVSAYGF
jgi:homoserine kinase type II